MARHVARIFDEYLVASARAGDRAAFERLAEHWQKRLFAHAYRLTGDMDMAQEAAQDSWLDIAKSISGLRDTKVFPAWAYRIVTRRVADNIRRVQRKRRTEQAYALEPKSMDARYLAMETLADTTPLGRAIVGLPLAQRAAIGLYYIEELSVAEISVALSVPVGTVKTRLMHARNKLRDSLNGEEL